MKNLLNTPLFGAALLVATAGFAQSSTSPQKGDEDRTPYQTSATSPSSTDTNSTGSTTGSGTTGSSTDTSATGTAGNSGTPGTTGTYGNTAKANGKTGTSKMTPKTYSGTVKTIDAGQTLVITMANGRTQTFDIRGSGRLNPAVVDGSRVRVRQTVDASGKTVVTVAPDR